MDENPLNAQFIKMLNSLEVRDFLKINRYDNINWYNKETFNELLKIVEIISIVSIGKNELLKNRFEIFINKIDKAGKLSGYQLEKLILSLR